MYELIYDLMYNNLFYITNVCKTTKIRFESPYKALYILLHIPFELCCTLNNKHIRYVPSTYLLFVGDLVFVNIIITVVLYTNTHHNIRTLYGYH